MYDVAFVLHKSASFRLICLHVTCALFLFYDSCIGICCTEIHDFVAVQLLIISLHMFNFFSLSG